MHRLILLVFELSTMLLNVRSLVKTSLGMGPQRKRSPSLADATFTEGQITLDDTPTDEAITSASTSGSTLTKGTEENKGLHDAAFLGTELIFIAIYGVMRLVAVPYLLLTRCQLSDKGTWLVWVIVVVSARWTIEWIVSMFKRYGYGKKEKKN